MSAGIAHMAEMGLETSVVAPSLLLATRDRLPWLPWRALALPAAAALPLFLAAHSAITIGMAFHEPPALEHLLLHGVLLVAALLFWHPVFGRTRRLSDPGRVAYLFLAMPTMDLAGVYVVLRGDQAGGIAMIVAMLPVGLIALAVSWRWLMAEERAARASDAQEMDAEERMLPATEPRPSR
jgi:cytochrome c oxidase assembly factor CtaG